MKSEAAETERAHNLRNGEKCERKTHEITSIICYGKIKSDPHTKKNEEERQEKERQKRSVP